MPRVVLFSAAPAPGLDRVASHADTWSGDPLSLVLVSLSAVADLDALDPDLPWPRSIGTTRPWSLRVHTYDEPSSPDTAADQERGRRLWDHVARDASIAPLLEHADAVVALDEGGLRTAFHIARRHRPPIATDGLVPALVELAARGTAPPPAQTLPDQMSEDSGSRDTPSPRR